MNKIVVLYKGHRIHLVDLQPVLQEDNFCDFLFTFLHINSVLKRGLSLKKQTCSRGKAKTIDRISSP